VGDYVDYNNKTDHQFVEEIAKQYCQSARQKASNQDQINASFESEEEE
jgi:hypothetical protein